MDPKTIYHAVQDVWKKRLAGGKKTIRNRVVCVYTRVCSSWASDASCDGTAAGPQQLCTLCPWQIPGSAGELGHPSLT